MKIKNKALVKHEIRNIWPVFVYFIGCIIIGLWGLAASLDDTYSSYLRNGYREDWEIYFSRPLQSVGEHGIVFLGAGVLLLLYLQFKDNKSLQVSSFMKSLPYTNKEVYKVKLSCGFLTITVPFVLGSMGVLGIRSYMNDFLTYVEGISAIGNELKNINSLSYILLYWMLLYGIVLFLYLFGFWMQYLVNNNVASLVISGLSLGAVPFIAVSFGNYVQCLANMKRNTGWLFKSMAQVVCPAMYLESEDKYYQIYNAMENRTSGLYVTVNAFMGIKLMILLVLIVMLLMAIVLCNKNYKAENQEAFISTAWAEHILKIGVVISCIGAVVFVVEGVIGVYTIGQKILMHLLMIGAGVIAYVIVCKVCAIGKR